jgi:hypothetical protein
MIEESSTEKVYHAHHCFFSPLRNSLDCSLQIVIIYTGSELAVKPAFHSFAYTTCL